MKCKSSLAYCFNTNYGEKKNKNKFDLVISLAYVVGIIATDGCIGKDRSYINITSKNKYIVEQCKRILKVPNVIGKKSRGPSLPKKYYVLQLRSIELYEFLSRIGIRPAKSKTIGNLLIPNKFFKDFMRGCIDDDGSTVTHKHPESVLPQLRIRLYSASLTFLQWIKEKINFLGKIGGGWIYSHQNIHALSFGKSDSIKIAKLIYHKNTTVFLQRKYDRIKSFLGE